MLKMRFKKFGRKKKQTFRIVVAESTSRRDGRPIQELGYYNPLTDEVRLDVTDILKHLQQGAQPTKAVRSLLEKEKIIEPSKSTKRYQNNTKEGTITMPMIQTPLINAYQSFSFHREYMDIKTHYEIKLDKQNINSELDVKEIAQKYVEQFLDKVSENTNLDLNLSNLKKYKFTQVETKRIPFNDHIISKFIQTYLDIKVYDSLLLVQLDKKQELTSINCTIGILDRFDKNNMRNSEEVLNVVKSNAGYEPLSIIKSEPIQYIYYDEKVLNQWRLVYIVKRVMDKTADNNQLFFPKFVDFVVDAQNLNIIDKLSKA